MRTLKLTAVLILTLVFTTPAIAQDAPSDGWAFDLPVMAKMLDWFDSLMGTVSLDTADAPAMEKDGSGDGGDGSGSEDPPPPPEDDPATNAHGGLDPNG